MNEHAKMPTCSLTKIIHNKWPQQSSNKVTCMYGAIVVDLIHAFLHIANYKSWLEGGFTGKGPNSTSLRLKATARCGDPKLVANAMKFYP